MIFCAIIDRVFEAFLRWVGKMAFLGANFEGVRENSEVRVSRQLSVKAVVKNFANIARWLQTRTHFLGAISSVAKRVKVNTGAVPTENSETTVG
jgi:hypothetical protein